MTLAAIDWLTISINLLLIAFVIVALLMSLLILMQRPKQEGLGAAFGSGMTDQMFGARTTNVLQKGTVYLASLFFILTLTLAILHAKKNDYAAQSQVQELAEEPAATEEEPVVEEEPAAGEEPAPSLEDEFNAVTGGDASPGDEETPVEPPAGDEPTEPAPGADEEEGADEPETPEADAAGDPAEEEAAEPADASDEEETPAGQ